MVPAAVWVVDDDADDQFLLEVAFKTIDPPIYIKQLYDGEDLLPNLERTDSLPKLVLLDLNMPKVTGKEVLEKIKSDPELEHLPVIVITNSDYKKDMIECYRLGADGYMQKPADFKKLVDFFYSVKKSIEVRNKLSIYYIEKEYYDDYKVAV